MKNIIAFFRYAILCLLFLSFSAFATNNILLIHSYHAEHFWTEVLKKEFNKSFQDDKNTLLFHEYMDLKRFPKATFIDGFVNFLKDKYKQTKFDVIIISDDAALNLIKEKRADFFNAVPVVYLGINRITQELIDTPNMTGVFERRDIGKVVLDIKQHTGLDEIIVVTDKSLAGKANLSKINAIKNTPLAPKRIHVIEDLKTNEIVEKFSQYDKHIPIFIIGQLISAGEHRRLVSWDLGAEALSGLVDNPIYSIAITSLEHGVVGANDLSGKQHAAKAVALIEKILAGIPVDDIKPITTADNQWVFNWKNLQKYNISLDSLPMNSKLIHQEETFYQKHGILVWLVAVILSVSLVIIILLIEIIRRGYRNRDILAENESRYKDLAYAGANIFWETDTEDHLSYISGDTRLALGIYEESKLGCSIEDICKLNTAIDFPWSEYKKTIFELKPLNNLVFSIKSSKNNIKILSINAKPIYDKKNLFQGYRGICKEITEEHRLSQRLAYQAAYDSLTGLINRVHFNKKFKNYVKQHHTLNEQAYICFLDLDRFKLINDTAGHLIGDAMLAEVATVINACIGNKDILGRLGGDEFGLVIKGKNRKTTQILCEKIISEVSNHQFHWNNRYFNVSVSIGVVPIGDSFNETELLSKADLSCYKAKEAGRGRVYIADLSSSELYSEELQMGYIANVTQTIEQNQFYLVKQVIKPIDQRSTDQEHYEILIRYRDEQGEIIPPGLFIPAAEKHGVITLIDNWVVKTIFERYHEFFPQNNTIVSINLSGISLSNNEFIENIIELVEKSTIAPKNICFEITETAAISQLSQALDFIHKMKELGIKFALDDFGSGASSFGYLKKLPVDYLKIDGSLVKNIVTVQTDRAIVKSINSIAHMMGMKTIAEFVENDEIADILKKIGVDYVQGYGIGKPILC